MRGDGRRAGGEGKERGRGGEGKGEGDGREREEGRKMETPPPSIPAYAPGLT